MTELKAAKGYRLDSQPYQIEVKDGGTATLEITNRQIGSAIIRKVDSLTGEGIYGVKFLISDASGHPVGTYESDNEGYVYIERELPDTHVTAHILRHTYITRLFESGLDIKEIQYLAGHSDIKMTLNVYSHVVNNRPDELIEAVERAFV